MLGKLSWILFTLLCVDFVGRGLVGLNDIMLGEYVLLPLYAIAFEILLMSKSKHKMQFTKRKTLSVDAPETCLAAIVLSTCSQNLH